MLKLPSLIVPLVLILIAVPLAAFAVFTSTLALLVLLVRATLVYVDVGASTVHSYLYPPRMPATSPATGGTSEQYKRKRRGNGGATSVSDYGKATSNAVELPSRAPTSDYEGVGGWRIPAADDRGEEEEAVWRSLNSRLELPAAAAERHRFHRRSASISSSHSDWNFRGEGTTSGPLSASSSKSKLHTPTASIVEVTPSSPDGYFGLKLNRMSSGSRT